MVDFDFSKLKSGTDVRGVAVGDAETVDLTDEVVSRIAKGFAVFLKSRLNKKKLTIAVGHDSRISAERLKRAVLTGLIDVNVNAVSIGLCSTPSMFMILKEKDLNCDGSIMLTASHHPKDKNGMKFFTEKGGVEGADVTEILNIAAKNNFDQSAKGEIEFIDYMPKYAQSLVNLVKSKVSAEKPLQGFHIVVDAGNGAGGFYAEKVLKVLGADISGSQFLEPDGNFPNHIPNPENKAAMDAISKCVINNKADLGIIFDTDVDRAAIVASDGEEINRNRLIALISAILLKEKSNATIVTDSITSIGLKEFITSLKGNHYRFKRGYRNVINEAIRLNREGIYTPLAIETSGHAALMENYFLDDGAYLVTRLIIEAAKLKEENKKLSDLIKDLKEPKEETEIRLSFTVPDFKEYGKVVLEDFKKYVAEKSGMSLETPNYEGVRVNYDLNHGNGWLLVRMSLHDPIMPINVESETEGGVAVIVKEFWEFVRAYKGLDVAPIEKFIF